MHSASSLGRGVPQSGSDFFWFGQGKQVYLCLDARDQVTVDGLVALLCADPSPDNVTKFELPAEVQRLFAYDDGEWRIVYRTYNAHTIQGLGLTRLV